MATARFAFNRLISRSTSFLRPYRAASKPVGLPPLLCAAHRGVHTHHGPVDPAVRVGTRLDGPDDPLPSAIRGPAPVPVVTGLPAPEPPWKVPPRDAGPYAEQDPIDDLPMSLPPSAPSGVLRQVRLQLGPFNVGQITPRHANPNDQQSSSSLTYQTGVVPRGPRLMCHVRCPSGGGLLDEAPWRSARFGPPARRYRSRARSPRRFAHCELPTSWACSDTDQPVQMQITIFPRVRPRSACAWASAIRSRG
jgi:hypothetical protein